MTTRPTARSARSVDEHRERIEHLLRPLAVRDVEQVTLHGARGRMLAEDMRSPLDLPVFRNSG
ncbi:MAG: molybdopterin molybdenumtransferase MoeA, partial [Nocardia sp.]|nr:molybdopterin molybdenumtransferase MoeA [Nocardia sp.]